MRFQIKQAIGEVTDMVIPNNIIILDIYPLLNDPRGRTQLKTVDYTYVVENDFKEVLEIFRNGYSDFHSRGLIV